MVDDIHIDYMYTDEEQREKDELLRKKLGDKEFERQIYGIVEKGSEKETCFPMNTDDLIDKDLPTEEIIKKAEEFIKTGGTIFIKFTCNFCGSRQTSANPNSFNTAGYYCGECGELCRPKKYGLMIIFVKGPNKELTLDTIKNIIASKIERGQLPNPKGRGS